uniref:Uncharacterized protein n=1 Tax=Rhizophora mucronata TaxID=61149 RepID=A0A2P2Q102_RHIMU
MIEKISIQCKTKKLLYFLCQKRKKQNDDKWRIYGNRCFIKDY